MDMKNNIVKRVIGVFMLMLVVLALVAVDSVYHIRRLIATSDWVNHTHAVILEAEGILSSLHAGDASLRSYLLTGDQRDQGTYRTAYNDMVEHLEIAKALTRTEQPQYEQFVQLEELIGKRVDFTRKVVKAREEKGLEGASQALAADASGEALGEIQRRVHKLVKEENGLLEKRDRESRLEAQSTRWRIHIGLAVNFLLLAFVGWLIRDDIAARHRATTALQEANAQLEIKVQERTAELVTANKSLTVENLERQWSNQALNHQLRYNQLIINSIGDLIFVISRALHISRINPAVVRQTRLEEPELIRRPIAELLHLGSDGAAGAVPTQDSFARAMKEGREMQDQSGTLCCKDGRVLPVRLSLVPLRDQDKVVGGVLTVRLCQDGSAKPE